MNNIKKERSSNIEFLKVIAIIMIVVAHCTQTINSSQPVPDGADYWIFQTGQTRDLTHIMLVLLRYLGLLGNDIFFICSAWFLLEKERSNKQKLYQMIMDAWVVSVIIFLLVSFDSSVQLQSKDVLQSLFPTLFCSNWYVSAYIMFALVASVLNFVIRKMSRKGLLKTALVMTVIYMVINPIVKIWSVNFFYMDQFTVWVAIYFVIAYIKLYDEESYNTSKCLLMTTFGLAGCLITSIGVNFLGFHIHILADKMLFWNSCENPFAVITAIGLFGLFRKASFQSRIINKISSLTLLIYLLHENVLFRQYYRPRFFFWLHDTYGYDHLVLGIFIYAAGILIASTALASIYKGTIQKITIRLSATTYPVFSNVFEKTANRLLRIL